MKVAANESLIHGTGLFTVDSVEQGEHIGTFEGEPVDEDDIHVLWHQEGDDWKGLSVSNVLKFANHSKSPNVEVVGRDMFALKRIEIGEEITFDYGEEWE